MLPHQAVQVTWRGEPDGKELLLSSKNEASGGVAWESTTTIMRKIEFTLKSKSRTINGHARNYALITLLICLCTGCRMSEPQGTQTEDRNDYRIALALRGSPVDRLDRKQLADEDWEIRCWLLGLGENDRPALVRSVSDIGGKTTAFTCGSLTGSFQFAKIIALRPRGGWNSFLQKARKLGLFEVTNWRDTKEHGAPDSITVVVEVRRGSRYVSAEFPVPWNSNAKSANRYSNVLSLFSYELEPIGSNAAH